MVPRASEEKFPGGGGGEKKKKTKKHTYNPFPGGGRTGKDLKIALLSFYLLYLYHIWGGHGPSLPTPMNGPV